MVVLVSGRVAVAGIVDDLLESHHRITGARRDPASLPAGQTAIEASHVERQSTMLVRSDGPILDPGWVVSAVTLDDVVLAYMRQARDGAVASAPTLAVAP